jgi:hypothetical protein
MGKVDILYRMGLFTSVRETLDFLIKENPDIQSPQGHLLSVTARSAAAE